MLQPCDDLTLTEERAMTNQPERKGIDAVTLAGGPPGDGKGVIDYLFPLTEEGAKPPDTAPRLQEAHAHEIRPKWKVERR